MLIPSMDLMGGKLVQLVQGDKRALEFGNFEPWIERFSQYRLVQVIDLDAAMRKGNNRGLVRALVRRLPCQVGGGIHTVVTAHQFLEMGARRVILGSALIEAGTVNVAFAQTLARDIGPENLVCALDSRGGKVMVKGWKEATTLTPIAMMRALEPYSGAFLYTHIDAEGLMRGIPLDIVIQLRAATARQLIVAGGIRNNEEVAQLDRINVDAVVGMAVYTGQIA